MDEFLERPTATIAYRSEGPSEARALITTHEPTGSRSHEDAWGPFDWRPVLRSGQRLVRYDIRGHGASRGRPERADYRWPALAEDLLALAHRVSPGAAVDLLGVATGCGTVLWAAARAPERVRRLVLVIPPPVGVDRERQSELYRAAADLAEVRGLEAWTRAAAGMPPVPVLVEGGWRREQRPALPAALLPHVVRGDADSTWPGETVLAALAHEVLILAWRDDASHPSASAEHLARLLPQGRVAVADRAEDVAGWGDQVAGFLTAPDAIPPPRPAP